MAAFMYYIVHISDHWGLVHDACHLFSLRYSLYWLYTFHSAIAYLGSFCFVVKYFPMQIVFKCKWSHGIFFFFFFQSLVAFWKMFRQIFYNVWSNVKIKIKIKPTPQHHRNWPKTHHYHHNPPHKPTATHPDPPQIKPPPESTKSPPRKPLRATAQNQESSSKSTKAHQLQPTGNT